MTTTKTASDVLVESNKVTVGFSRSATPRQYHKVEASIFVPTDVLPTDSADEVLAKIEQAFARAKSVVFDQLSEYGIASKVDEAGVVRELVEKLQATEVKPKAAPRFRPAPSPNGVARRSDNHARPSKEQLAELLVAELCGDERDGDHLPSFYDNRTSRQGRQPHFKHKKSGAGVWLDTDSPQELLDAVNRNGGVDGNSWEEPF